jgi:hypothetical protein
MEAFDANLEPQVTIVKKETETREEYRIKGKLYMVKVTPAVGKPYYWSTTRATASLSKPTSPSVR